MNYLSFQGGPFSVNTYVVYDDKRNAVVIDPSDHSYFLQLISMYSFNPVAVLLTHGHFDHIWDVDRVLADFNVPVYLHGDDLEMLSDPSKNFSSVFGLDMKCSCSPELINDGDILSFGDLAFKVIHTPGHSEGSVCYYIDNHLFSGDTLFQLSVGRTDGYMGDFSSLKKSLGRLSHLPLDCKVFPGHGKSTLIEFELSNNPYFK